MNIADLLGQKIQQGTQGVAGLLGGMLGPTTYHYDWSSKTTPNKSVNMAPNPTVTPNPTAQPSDQQLADQIKAGYRKYSGGKEVPMEQYIPQMVEAAKKYPIFQQNPYLIPAVSIVETSAGRNWKLNNNPLSWAARVQQSGGYNPTDSSQSIGDMISAVGGDPNRGAGFDPQTAKTRQAQTAPYQKYRQSNQLADFATTYEDPGNKAYLPALQSALKNFQ